MRIYIKILAIASVLFFTSCEDWLDVQQEGEFESEYLYDKGEGYRAVLNGLYKLMGTPALYGRELSYGMVDCISQQYDMSNKNANTNEVYEYFQDFKYENNSVVNTIDNTWLAAFKVIANANDLIQNVETASVEIFRKGELERDLILGEAYACRALLHFDMLRLFAPAPINDDKQTYVPYVESYPNILATGIQVAPFLDKVIVDLLKAKELVAQFDTSRAGVEANSTVSARTSLASANYTYDYEDFFYGRAYRLSYYSITALLARVYQYANKQKEAFDCAKEVVEYGTRKGGKAFYEDNFDGVLAKSGEDIQAFEGRTDYKAKSNIIFSAYNEKMYNDEIFKNMFNAGKDPNAGGHANIYFMIKRVELFNNRGTDEWQLDLRSANMIILAIGQYPISGKWYIPSTKPEASEHLMMSPIVRLTEMRYIMAEYYAREGKFGEAYGILNDIRAKRRLSKPLMIQSRFPDFVEDLVGDARREWISEGQLFYLYKRLDAPFIKNNQLHKLTKAEACLPLPADQK